MKSKKLSSNKTSWNSYDKNIGYSSPILPKENSSVSQSIRETVSNTSIAVDSPAMVTSTNSANSRTLQVFSFSLFSFSSQPFTVMQSEEVNVSAV